MKVLLSVSIFFMFSNLMIKSDFEIKEDNSSYCVMSINDNSILDSENRELTQSVASISKIMTAIVAIEQGQLNKKVTIDKSIDKSIGSSLYLIKGDTYTLKDLLYGLMLRSGNDAALMIASTISKNEKSFVEEMNKKAKEIGLNQTVFRNASGLDEMDGGNISSACDMATLMSYAMQNDIFREIVSTTSYSPKKGILWNNKNRFLNLYEFSTGGKTGYTKVAGRTLVTTSKVDDFEIVSVTLNVSDDFNLHVQMHNWAYENYQVLKILEEGKYIYNNKTIYVDKPFYQTIEKQKENNIKVNTKWEKKKFYIESIFENFKNEHRYEVTYE